MIKILFVITQSEFGGAQRYVFEMVKGLNPEKYNFIVAAGQGDGELFEKMSNVKCQMSNLNVRCQILKYLKRTPSLWQIILTIKEIYDLLKKEKPDALFLCSTTAGLLGSTAGFLYKNKFRVPSSKFQVLYRIGGWAFNDPRNFWLNKIILWLEKLTARFKDKIIVNSEFDRQSAIKYKICSAEKLVKIYNGINVDKLDFLPRKEARKKLSSITKPAPANGIWVGTVANFYKTKGLEYLIEAARILNSRLHSSDFGGQAKFIIHNSKFIILIIGDGRQRPELEKLIKKYRLEETVFLAGKIPDGYKYLKAFDVFVLPSLKEGFPWVVLEAMAAKTPIIATKVGAVPEIIADEKQGFLTEPKNSRDLAEKIVGILNHPEQAKNMASLAKQKLEKEFTLQKMLEQSEKLLNCPVKGV